VAVVVGAALLAWIAAYLLVRYVRI